MPARATSTGRAAYFNQKAFTPLDVPSLVGWWDAGEGITKDGSNLVSAWADRSGNGRTLVQANATQQPLWTANVVNGRPGVVFDGNDNSMQVTFTFNQPGAVFMLVRQDTWTNSDRIFNGGATEAFTIYNDTTTPNISLFAGSVGPTNTGFAVNTFAVISGILNGASSSLRVNLGTAATGNAGALNPGGVTLAANALQNNNFGNVTHVELAVYSAVPSASQQEQLVRYLALKGGISL